MNEHKLWKIIYACHNIISDLRHENTKLKERNEVLEDVCEILRKQSERWLRLYWDADKAKEQE